MAGQIYHQNGQNYQPLPHIHTQIHCCSHPGYEFHVFVISLIQICLMNWFQSWWGHMMEMMLPWKVIFVFWPLKHLKLQPEDVEVFFLPL
jgi:hypothetical protein